MIGETLGSYRLVEKLGEGGMGEVYRAHDEMLDRDVALKMLRPELARRPQTVERFRAEAITLAKLDHPGIARIHGASRHGELWFIVMEFVRGETLQARLHRAGRLNWTEVVPILCQLLDSLEYAHRLGVVHRDMKPANVLISPDGRVKVTDFGIARVLGTERATRTGHVVGTLEYMAPEQVRGEEVDGRTDLYAVGIMLHELLTGHTPFQGAGEYEVMMQHLQAPIPSMRKGAPDAPSWFDGILQRALAKSRDDRFTTASEFQGAIETLASTEAGIQLRPTRLAIPKATQPEAPPDVTELPHTVGLAGRTRIASDAEAATVLGTGSNPAIRVPPHVPPPPLPPTPPPTRLATATPPPPTTLAAPPPMPPAATTAAQAPAPAASTLPWRALAAAAAVLVLLSVLGLLGVRALINRQTEVKTADAGHGVEQPKPREPIYDAPDPGVVIPSPGLPAPSPDTGAPPPSGRRIALPGSGGTTGGSSPRGSAPAPAPAPGPAPAPAPGPAPEEHPAAPPPKVEEAAPAPPVAETNAVEIDEIALIVGDGKDREEKEVIVRFESQRLVIRDADNEEVIRAVAYRSLDATYARARYPVGKADRDRPAYVQGVAKGGGLFRRVPHWLTLESSGPAIVFKLDGGQAEKMVGLLEGRASVKVERVSER